MQRPIERVFFGFALALSLACLCFGVYALRIPRSYQVLNFVMLTLGASLLVGAAFSVRHRWKIRPVLTCLIGVLSTVYALSTALRAWQHTGATIAGLLLVLTLAALAVLCFRVMFNRQA